MRSTALRLLSRISRRRPLNSAKSDSDEVDFKKCLSTYDLVALGVGSCCGTGMFLTVGLVAKELAGPGAVFSFIIAGIGSLLSGICYAELASSCPRTSGSAYMYSYVTVGELVAYVIGWGLIVEYVIGTAAGAVALSATLDSIFNFAFSKLPELHFTVGGRPYFDFIAIAVCLTLTFILAYGVELSTSVNNVLTCVNAVVWIFFIGASASFAQITNWTAHGFFPFGANGVIRALPIAYFAFIGFDTVASSGQEAQDPQKSIPKSILWSVVINTVAFCSVTLCLTLVLPYFSLHTNTAMVDAFSQREAPLVRYVISVGAICALFAATFGSMFPLPRVLYAMADDGLIFKQFAKLCPKRKTPKLATLAGGLVATLLAVTTDLNMLIELVLIGTLMAYVLVAVCVLLLRYRKTSDKKQSESDLIANHHLEPDVDQVTGSDRDTGSDIILNGGNQVGDGHKENLPSWMIDSSTPSMKTPLLEVSEDNVFKVDVAKQRCYKMLHHFRDPGFLLTVLLVCEVGISVLLAKFFELLFLANVALLTLTVILITIFVICFCFLLLCPQTGVVTTFQSPCVPALPVGVTFFNIYLMVSLSAATWCAFAVWMTIGFLVYFFYGIKRSKLELEKSELVN
ncbi:probable cationic amino acid transporter [Gigantopelta aegis]|uniref:probable cationic amino acid transporter n=1 Tax=Gigantopelta aegis TaxID=1735272 RepID=UPI001B888915|nr:probable cationic amino acid transporter [Gigantopelta aegis]XP_041377708.1 probable cationic amino acid transporter [Gigantopelta aegis]XP_041377709.1 probable cationic amino acid transporter [Gigantopelta aegis]XP_041377710.1 probable cationic amino acid transporter [Gigantopelta aegis]XP_041377711.1 probable cationic amino acid transporter [Gigantopelta aegis]